MLVADLGFAGGRPTPEGAWGASSAVPPPQKRGRAGVELRGPLAYLPAWALALDMNSHIVRLFVIGRFNLAPR